MKRGTRAYLELSFGMIFSIILIIVFLAFTGYVLTKLVGGGDKAQIAKFTNDLRNDITRAWVSSYVSETNEYNLPKKIEHVCFIDFSSDGGGKGSPDNTELYDELNMEYFGEGEMVLYPADSGEGLDSNTLEHVNLTKITKSENPYCIENKKGKISITIKKGYRENLITLTR
ncbi:MAG: hypothetical protein AABX88_02600 [Nanoarchaeota archaeon]